MARNVLLQLRGLIREILVNIPVIVALTKQLLSWILKVCGFVSAYEFPNKKITTKWTQQKCLCFLSYILCRSWYKGCPATVQCGSYRDWDCSLWDRDLRGRCPWKLETQRRAFAPVTGKCCVLFCSLYILPFYLNCLILLSMKCKYNHVKNYIIIKKYLTELRNILNTRKLSRITRKTALCVFYI